MSHFTEVEREEIVVQFVRVLDGLEHIQRAWNELEAVVALRGRHTLPGGRYLRARLRGGPPGVYERIGPTFDELVRAQKPDTSRPSLEHYRRYDEIDLLLPV